jgi:hypothetical protein
MEPIELLRTCVFKTTNNPELTDAIIDIFEVAGDDTEIAMRSLGSLVGYEFGEFIMQLADIAFDREPGLCVDPSYEDAKVETEARPKHPTGCFVQPIVAQGKIGNQQKELHQWQHIRKFHPFLEYELTKRANMSPMERLMYETRLEIENKYPFDKRKKPQTVSDDRNGSEYGSYSIIPGSI